MKNKPRQSFKVKEGGLTVDGKKVNPAETKTKSKVKEDKTDANNS